MGERAYSNPRALEMAVKAAAKSSQGYNGRTIDDFFAGRLMERVFSEGRPSFILKGGKSVLARTVDARYTKDTDFLYAGSDLEEALEELKRLAAVDLGDFLEFRFKEARPIAKEQEYREGLRVLFSMVYGGTKRKGDVSVDLVVDAAYSHEADVVEPVGRLQVEGLRQFPYYIYPAAQSVADKVCATMQRYGEGGESSRIRDLVDLVVYVRMESFRGEVLGSPIVREGRVRRMGELDCFRVPESWKTSLAGWYVSSAKEAGLPEELQLVGAAEELVKNCVDPAIAGQVDGQVWNPVLLVWEDLCSQE